MKGIRRLLVALVFGMAVLSPSAAAAQSWIVDAHLGRATFISENRNPRTAVGVAARKYVLPKINLGLGVTQLRGPGRGRILFTHGLASLDLSSSAANRKLVPYLSLAAGVMHHTNQFSVDPSITGAVEVMLGARLRVGQRWFIAPQAGLGITTELYTRFGISVGFVH